MKSCLYLLAACLAAGPAAAAAPLLYGVNISGAELNPTSQNRLNTDYVYPSTAELDWTAAEKMSAIRLPVLWQRLQPSLTGGLDPTERAHLAATIDAARAHGVRVIIDVHNFGFYREDPVGSTAVPAAAFARFWSLMADAFKADDTVVFDIMNEPHTIEAQDWRDAAQAAITAIRATGARNLVLVPGTYWDGAHDFVDGGGEGGSNAIALQNLTDPAGNMVIEVHQYLDGNYSGTSPDCAAPGAAVATLTPFTNWARQNHRKGFLGEFGGGPSAQCRASLAAMLHYMASNPDVWAGWTYWAAGAWWNGDYPFSVEPSNGHNKPQTAVLESAIAALPPTE